MKLRKTIANFSTAIVAILMLFNLNACTGKSPTSTAAGTSGPEIIEWNKNSSQTSLSKIVNVSQLVTMQDGGELTIDYQGKKRQAIQVTVSVPPGSISQDAVLGMSLDDKLLMVSFQIPEGVTFSELPDLKIAAQGLDLSHVDVEDLSVYCSVAAADDWIVADNFTVVEDSASGSLEAGGDFMITIQSRYAIGTEQKLR